MDAEFLPAGIDRAALKPLAQRSDRAGLTRLAGHSATLAGTGALVLLAAGQPVLLVPAMALHGAALMFLFAFGFWFAAMFYGAEWAQGAW